jgi:hypothetical protein
MAQSATIRFEGLDELLALIRALSRRNVISNSLLSEIGLYIESSILLRTAAGKDANGKFFEPYSPKYRLFRSEQGRPINRVDVNFFGTMLSSLTHTVFDDRVEVFFMRTYGKDARGKSSDVSSPEKAYFLNKQRKFFALGKKDRAVIGKMIRAEIRKIIEEN